MSYQPLFLGLGTAVISTSASTSYLEGETVSLRLGQALVFSSDDAFGGVPANSVVYVKQIIDADNFTISAIPDGDVLELVDGTGFMIAKSVQREAVTESLRKVDVMLGEIYDAGIGIQVGIQNVVDDSTPTLGGTLDLNSNDITGTGNIDIAGIVTATKFRLPSLTVAQRDAIFDWQNGDLIYNLTIDKIQGYQNSTWMNLDGTTV